MLVWICSSPSQCGFFWCLSLHFPHTAVISEIAKANSLLLITPLEVFSLSWGYALHLVVWKLFILRMFLTCLQLFTSTSKFPFCVFSTFWGVTFVAITFSIKEEENMARHTSSKDSMTMNLGKSAASFSKSDSDKFILFYFLLEDAISDVHFLLGLCSTTHHGVQLVLGMNQGGNPFTLVETEIHNQYIQAESKFSSPH